MNAKFSAPGKHQAGFTLPEMLIAMVIVVIMIIAARGMISTTLTQLKHLSVSDNASEFALSESLQWLENDIVQIRGDLPWYGKGSLAPESCMKVWTFSTENKAQLPYAGTVLETVRYRVEGETLWRDVIQNNQQTLHSLELLKRVTCIHLRFYQGRRWHNIPLPHQRIRALSVTIRSHEPSVERIWPVDLMYENQ